MKLGLKNSDRTLESFRIFPIVAWGITILFAVFVYQITLDLKAVTAQIEAQTNAQANATTTSLDGKDEG